MKKIKSYIAVGTVGIALASASVLGVDGKIAAGTEATLQAQTTVESKSENAIEVNSEGSVQAGLGIVEGIHAIIEQHLGVDLGAELRLMLEGGLPELPERPDRGEMAGQVATEVRAVLGEAGAAREAFIEAQAELRSELRGTAAEERENVRNELHERREAWLAVQKNIGLELRTRLAELRAELQDGAELEAVLASAKDEAKQRRGED